jgi:hypothetical protein
MSGRSTPLVWHKQSLLRGNLIVFTSAQRSVVWGQHPFGPAQATLLAWQSDCAHFCTKSDCPGGAQESIVWEDHTLGLAEAILVAWQSD